MHILCPSLGVESGGKHKNKAKPQTQHPQNPAKIALTKRQLQWGCNLCTNEFEILQKQKNTTRPHSKTTVCFKSATADSSTTGPAPRTSSALVWLLRPASLFDEKLYRLCFVSCHSSCQTLRTEAHELCFQTVLVRILRRTTTLHDEGKGEQREHRPANRLERHPWQTFKWFQCYFVLDSKMERLNNSSKNGSWNLTQNGVIGRGFCSHRYSSCAPKPASLVRSSLASSRCWRWFTDAKQSVEQTRKRLRICFVHSGGNVIPLDWTAWDAIRTFQALWRSRRKEPGKKLFTSEKALYSAIWKRMLGLNYRTLYAPQLCSKIVCAREYIFRHLLDCLVLKQTHIQFDKRLRIARPSRPQTSLLKPRRALHMIQNIAIIPA